LGGRERAGGITLRVEGEEGTEDLHVKLILARLGNLSVTMTI